MRLIRFVGIAVGLMGLVALVGPPLRSQTPRPHNVVLFVPDGLRAFGVTPETAPTMAGVRDRGVNLQNSHSLFPTVTTPNASAMATGHYFGDTGDFSNTIFSAFAVPSASGSTTPFLENDPVLGDMDQHFGGNYLNETTVVHAASEAGLSTALIGKLGPALIFDHSDRTGAPTIVVDDSTGTPNGVPLADSLKAALEAAGLPIATPARGENGKAGTSTTPGTVVPNRTQQDYFVDVATKVVLPMFKARRQPFLLVFWSRDPDGTQHNQGDSLNALTPGINGPSSLAAVRNADDDLAKLRQTIADLGLAATTDVVVSADHGFSTASKQSQTSASARQTFNDVPHGFLPPGFLALDLGTALQLPVYDPDNKLAAIAPPAFPKRGNGVLGSDPSHPDIVVAANGGSDLVYLPNADRVLASRVVAALLAEDYVSGLFVDSTLGTFAGALPLSAINLDGDAVTPKPSIVVNFRTWSTGCAQPVMCAVEVSDTTLQQGQGMHGSFSRADTMNFMAAEGPDFKTRFVDDAPSSNADIGRTLAHLLGLSVPSHGKLLGRVLSEALKGGATPPHTARTQMSQVSTTDAKGHQTVLRYQEVGSTRYFDAAGFVGRTVGVEPATGRAGGER